MPSDKHNLRTDGARDTNQRRFVPRCAFINRSCYSACIRVLPLYPFDIPFFPSQLRMVTICGRHKMASVWDIKINEALLVLCLAYYVMKQGWDCWNWYIMAFTYRDIGRVFASIFSVMLDGLQRCFSCCSLPILLCNRQNIAKYEAYSKVAEDSFKDWDNLIEQSP